MKAAHCIILTQNYLFHRAGSRGIKAGEQQRHSKGERGNSKIKNRADWITRFQTHSEYCRTIDQGVERLPGFWKRETQAGGFSYWEGKILGCGKYEEGHVD